MLAGNCAGQVRGLEAQSSRKSRRRRRRTWEAEGRQTRPDGAEGQTRCRSRRAARRNALHTTRAEPMCVCVGLLPQCEPVRSSRRWRCEVAGLGGQVSSAQQATSAGRSVGSLGGRLAPHAAMGASALARWLLHTVFRPPVWARERSTQHVIGCGAAARAYSRPGAACAACAPRRAARSPPRTRSPRGASARGTYGESGRRHQSTSPRCDAN